MAAKHKAAKAGELAASARNNPYVQLLLEDAELRENMKQAYESARRAYGRVSDSKGPSKALLEDKKVHKDLEKAAKALREVAITLREGPKKKRRRWGRYIILALVGGALALVFSESLRNKVLDALFGAEEEFDYTSTTVPTESSPPPPAASPPPPPPPAQAAASTESKDGGGESSDS
jgi:hypothetical protein